MNGKHDHLRLAFEGHTFSQDHGGISRMWRRILPLLVESDRSLSVAILLRLYRARSAPHHPKIKRITHIEDTRLAGFGSLLQLVTERRLTLWKPSLYQSMSYSRAPLKGLFTVQCVYDCIHEAFPAVTGNPAFSVRKKEALSNAQYVVAISQATKDDLIEYHAIDPQKVAVVHLAADEFFSLGAEDQEAKARLRWFGVNKPYFLYVGNRGNYKNFHTLLRAFAHAGFAAEYDLVAMGGEPELRHTENEYVIRNRLEKSIRLLPKLSDRDLRLLYQNAEAFVYPSLKEGFGLPILEAMRAGTPVVASDIPAFVEIGTAKDLRFDPHDPDQLQERLLNVTRDRENRSRWIREGKRIAERFTWEKTAFELVNVYRSLNLGQL